MAKKKAARRARRQPSRQPRIWIEIKAAETKAIIDRRDDAFYFGDGRVNPNENNGADLTRYTGAQWVAEASKVAAKLPRSSSQWKSDLLSTALEFVRNTWCFAHGKKNPGWGNKNPVAYRLDWRSMGAQLAWARGNGANV